MSLAPDEKLIYINSNRTFTDTHNIIYVARLIKEENGWYTFELIVNQLGYIIDDPIIVKVSAKNILSDRPVKNLAHNYFYHINPEIEFSECVYKTNHNEPLNYTTSSGFGSGIHGIYVNDYREIEKYVLSDDDIIYQIDCQNPYVVQDYEHGNSLTIASLQTNRYIDNILNYLTSYNEILTYISNFPFDNIVRLWNMTFLRSKSEFIDHQFLKDIFVQYITDYFTPSKLFDSYTKEPLIVQPINYILTALGYDGIIFDHNIGWDKYCVSFDLQEAHLITGSWARLKNRSANA